MWHRRSPKQAYEQHQRQIRAPERANGKRDTEGRYWIACCLSIGVGGMIGAGIFSILESWHVLQVPPCPFRSRSEGWLQGSLPTATSHSEDFPSVGGAVTFLFVVRRRRGFWFTQPLPVLQLHHHIALYATGFAAYAVTFIHLPSKVWAAVVVLAFTAINFLGSRLMGRAESVIVIIKVAILIVFIVAAFMALTGRGCSAVTSFLAGSSAIFTGQASCSLATRLWPDHECCSQHCQAEARVATCDLRQRRHCDRDLLAGRERCCTNVPLES